MSHLRYILTDRANYTPRNKFELCVCVGTFSWSPQISDQNVSPYIRISPLFMIWNKTSRKICFTIFSLTEWLCDDIIWDINSFNPGFWNLLIHRLLLSTLSVKRWRQIFSIKVAHLLAGTGSRQNPDCKSRNYFQL